MLGVGKRSAADYEHPVYGSISEKHAIKGSVVGKNWFVCLCSQVRGRLEVAGHIEHPNGGPVFGLEDEHLRRSEHGGVDVLFAKGVCGLEL